MERRVRRLERIVVLLLVAWIATIAVALSPQGPPRKIVAQRFDIVSRDGKRKLASLANHHDVGASLQFYGKEGVMQANLTCGGGVSSLHLTPGGRSAVGLVGGYSEVLQSGRGHMHIADPQSDKLIHTYFQVTSLPPENEGGRRRPVMWLGAGHNDRYWEAPVVMPKDGE